LLLVLGVVGMADMSYVTKVIEPKMIAWVSIQVEQTLTKKTIQVGINSKNKPVHFEVDGISPDEKIICLASTSNSNKGGQTRKLFRDAAILLKVPAERKIMVFLEDGRKVWETFFADNDGILDLTKIEPMFCKLSDELMIELNEARKIAKLEVGDRGRVKAVGGGRR
jgi:hypothetical protein